MGKHKDKKHKPKKEKKKHKRRHSSSSDSSSASTEDEWVEKLPKHEQISKPEEPAPKEREDWFSLPSNFLTSSSKEMKESRKEAKRIEKQNNQYNPSTSVRELNPYWKDNGTGLPSPSQFKKPALDDMYDADGQSNRKSHKTSKTPTSNWKKTKDLPSATIDSKSTLAENLPDQDKSAPAEDTKVLSNKELNALAAKLVKAEIMGNTPLIKELTARLNTARKLRADNPGAIKDHHEQVVLTQTDSKGYSRPLQSHSSESHADGKAKAKKQKVETHNRGERERYFADDDKYSLKQMFEQEKFNTTQKQNEEFINAMGKTKNDDLDEIFADKIRKKESDEKTDRRNRDKAIADHQKITKTLDNCNKCLQSVNVSKHLMISMSSHAYLSLPSHEPLTDGHCLLIPTRHVVCSTQLDENEWEDIMDYRKSLTKLFASRGDDVIFFEVAYNFHRFPHMVIQCVPIEREVGDLAPIYFKKAIDESETEWATNKKLISLKDKNVRRAVPKGLPYFFVSFGMQEGYAHVIEDEEAFPNNFAQEIIGGMLDLHHSKWRNPKRQSFQQQSERVGNFTKSWTPFDHTK